MNIKIMTHICPWEIDHFMLMVDKLKESSYFISDEDTLYFESVLNLSKGITDWDNSDLPQEYFIEKYINYSTLLEPEFQIIPNIRYGSDVYGHLDLQRDAIEDHIDYYIYICPDISFDEYTLFYLVESAKHIENKYFVITPEIYKCWDASWDVLVNEKFQDVPYEECLDRDIHSIRNELRKDDKMAQALPIDEFKFAGWFDLYNKAAYEQLFKLPEEVHGYGPFDFYSMTIANFMKKNGRDVQQYVMRNNVIWFYDVGALKSQTGFNTEGRLKATMKEFLKLKTTNDNQRQDFEVNMNKYLKEAIERIQIEKL